MKVLFILIYLVSLKPVFGFNWKKCDGYMDKVGHLGSPILSTSSFFSSTGDCAMIGSIEERKQQFLAFNLEHMANDISRGGGEYLTAYSQLLGCSTEGNRQLGKSLQDNFGLLFNTNSPYSHEKAYKQIEDLISSDPILNKSCKINS